MERERWLILYRLVLSLDRGETRGVFTAAVIVSVFFWGVIWDRPIAWACRRANWPVDLRPRRLPSQSTMSRRLKTPAVAQLMQAVGAHPALCGHVASDQPLIIDAKPLPIGGHSKDPESRWGQGVRSLSKGYKLYALWGAGPMPLCWRVAAANISEQAMAEQMIAELPQGDGYLLGDKLYDINKLYDLAAQRGYQLLAERKRPGTALGHCRHSPARLRGLALLQTEAGRTLYQQRGDIERRFSGLTCFGGRLSPLPAWVRRQPRVQRWLHAKLIVNAIRQLLLNQPLAVA